MNKSVLGLTVAGVLLLGGYATTTLANDDTTSSTGTWRFNFNRKSKQRKHILINLE
jgi:hypothetical protein